MSRLDLPIVHPQRNVVGFRPIKALRHFGRLVADKEDTEQVFHIIDSLKGTKSLRQMRNFIPTPEAQELLTRDQYLPDYLDDHARWAGCDTNSLAQNYIRFMRREGLSAAGLVEENLKFQAKIDTYDDLYAWYINRLRDTHDLFHVLTSYGRDSLGEVCLLGFSYEQNLNPGVLFIAYLGTREINKTSGGIAPVFDALREGRRLGREAKKLAHQDMLKLLPEDIEAVRAQLNVGAPTIYRDCLARFDAAGYDGHILSNADQSAPAQAKAA
jgi:ubiquinone biosynthesis protein COQ4